MSSEGPRPRRFRRRWVWPLVGGVAVVGILFVGVYPTQAYLTQRQVLAVAEADLAALRVAGDELEARMLALDTDAEIERIARERYGLVRRGEQAFVVLPPPPAAVVPGGFLAQVGHLQRGAAVLAVWDQVGAFGRGRPADAGSEAAGSDGATGSDGVAADVGAGSGGDGTGSAVAGRVEGAPQSDAG